MTKNLLPEVAALQAHDRAVTELGWRIADLQADLVALQQKRPAILHAAQAAVREHRKNLSETG